MLDKQRLGAEIKKRRKQKKLTQIQLADGICDQSEISRIESGGFFPSMDVLHLIASRLQLPISYFFDVLTHEDAEQRNEIFNRLEALSLNKRFEELYSAATQLLSGELRFHPETEKFIRWQQLVAEHNLGKRDVRHCLSELNLLVKKKTAGTDSLLNLKILNSIANIFAEQGDYTNGLEMYRKIGQESAQVPGSEKLSIKVLYNSGKLLYMKEDYLSSLNTTDAGINLSIEQKDMSLLGQLNYQKGAILEKLDQPLVEIEAAYQKANFFFELLSLDVHQKILKENKSEFLIKTMSDSSGTYHSF